MTTIVGFDSSWDEVDPVGDVLIQTVGNRARIGLPAGVEHNLFGSVFNAPRIRQPLLADADFDIITKITDTPAIATSTGAGIWIEQDANNFIRFDLGCSVANNRLFYCASLIGGTFTQRLASNLTVQTYPAYLRAKRTGNNFKMYRSNDSFTWVELVSFNLTMTVNWIGLHAVNAGTTPPARTVEFEAFWVDAPPSGTTTTIDVTEVPTDAVELTIKNNIAITIDFAESADIVEMTMATRTFRRASIHNRIRETTSSTGPYSFTLTGAVAGFKTLASRYAIGEPITVTIAELNGSGWMTVEGHLKTSSVFIVDIVEESSNNDDFVTFPAGTKEIFVHMPSRIMNQLNSGA